MKPNSSAKTRRSARNRKQVQGTYRELAQKLPAAKRPLLDPAGPIGFASADTLRIVLPEPHALLHAHNKGFWHPKAQIVKVLRWKAMKRCQSLGAVSWPAATMEYYFFLPATGSMKDEANLVQSQKPAIDGVVDAKVIPDDSIRYLHVTSIWCGVDAANPRVELIFRRSMVSKLAALRRKLLKKYQEGAHAE